MTDKEPETNGFMTLEEAKEIVSRHNREHMDINGRCHAEGFLEGVRWALGHEAVKGMRDNSDEVMLTLEEYGGSIVPHLVDTDDNAGQKLRESIIAFDNLKAEVEKP